MAEAEPDESKDSRLDIDADIDAWIPVDIQPEPCPYCAVLVTTDGYWVVENPDDVQYTPYCNEFHYQAYKKIGLWAEEKKFEPSPLEL